ESKMGKNRLREEDDVEKMKIGVEYGEGKEGLEEDGGKGEEVADLVLLVGWDVWETGIAGGLGGGVKLEMMERIV
uniref:hypothetical protein n=1 Tax=Cytobacillus oceanisediminis TaxID=665099 RepID=UPI0037BE7291